MYVSSLKHLENYERKVERGTDGQKGSNQEEKFKLRHYP